MRFGMIRVNCYKRVNPGLPFGETGKSGYEREMGFAAMAEYTQKSVWINVDAALPDWYAL
jgi:acyl-CoA reductase-like NAD-dependent aldehyde dehydrogenase